MKTFLGKQFRRAFWYFCIVWKLERCKITFAAWQVGEFFQNETFKMCLLVMLIRSSELLVLGESLPVQDMLMFLWQMQPKFVQEKMCT